MMMPNTEDAAAAGLEPEEETDPRNGLRLIGGGR